MSGWRFTLKQPPALRVDLRGITPTALAGMAAADVERLPVGCGNETLPLAEFFGIEVFRPCTFLFDGADESRKMRGAHEHGTHEQRDDRPEKRRRFSP